ERDRREQSNHERALSQAHAISAVRPELVEGRHEALVAGVRDHDEPRDFPTASLPTSTIDAVRGERDRREQSNHERHHDAAAHLTNITLDEAMAWAHILVLLVD